MIRGLFTTLSLLVCLFASAAHAQDTLRIMTYNILNFSSSSSDRLDELRKVLRAADPDVIVMQEILDGTAVNNILTQVLRQFDPAWNAASFVNGPDTDNACFYNSSLVTLESQRQIPTELRDFSEYVFVSEAMPNEEFRLYSAHLKASSGSDNEQQRRDECEIIRGEFSELGANAHFMFAGDFNLYSSFEPAYQLLLSIDPEPESRLLDPINRPGAWNNSISFADIHTQSPRTESFGGGATGGMDDRFDFILASAAWMDTTGSYLLPATYHTFGNDGQHFNQAINDGTNEAVPDSIADALHDLADHLPVVVDVVLRATSPVGAFPPVAYSHDLLKCYPNPFNPILSVELSPALSQRVLFVYDVLGRRLSSKTIVPSAAPSMVKLDFTGNASGKYFVTMQSDAEIVTVPVIFQK